MVVEQVTDWVGLPPYASFRVVPHRQQLLFMRHIGSVDCPVPQEQGHLHVELACEDGVGYVNAAPRSQEGLRLICQAVERAMPEWVGMAELALRSPLSQTLPPSASSDELEMIQAWLAKGELISGFYA